MPDMASKDRPAPRGLRLPRFHADKLDRKEMPSGESNAEYGDLVNAYYEAGAIAEIEAIVRDVVNGFSAKGADSERAFSQSMHFGYVKAMATLQAQSLAIVHRYGKLIKDLKSRVAELEARPSLHDAGVYDKSASYEKGAVVTHDGSAWVARLDSTGVVPPDGACWRLMVKRGRDAPMPRWDRTISYRAGSFVRHNRCVWLSQRESTGIEPTDKGYEWQLVKRETRESGE